MNVGCVQTDIHFFIHIMDTQWDVTCNKDCIFIAHLETDCIGMVYSFYMHTCHDLSHLVPWIILVGHRPSESSLDPSLRLGIPTLDC